MNLKSKNKLKKRKNGKKRLSYWVLPLTAGIIIGLWSLVTFFNTPSNDDCIVQDVKITKKYGAEMGKKNVGTATLDGKKVTVYVDDIDSLTKDKYGNYKLYKNSTTGTISNDRSDNTVTFLYLLFGLLMFVGLGMTTLFLSLEGYLTLRWDAYQEEWVRDNL